MSKMVVCPLVPSGLIVERVEVGAVAITLTVRRVSLESACPFCGRISRRIHSRYWRSLADLPSHGQLVRLRLAVHRFRCIDQYCRRRIFAERLGGTIAPASARRTTRLECIIHHLGLALGGRAGASLARRLVLPVSKDTLLRAIRRHYRPPSDAPGGSGNRRLGVEARASLWHHHLRSGAAPDHRSPSRSGKRDGRGVADGTSNDLRHIARPRRRLWPSRRPWASRGAAGRRSLAPDGERQRLLPSGRSMRSVREAIGSPRTIDLALLTKAESLQFEGYRRR